MKHAIVAVGFDSGYPVTMVCVCGRVLMRPGAIVTEIEARESSELLNNVASEHVKGLAR